MTTAPRLRARALLAAVLVTSATAAIGCGSGDGPAATPTQLLVTEDFGSRSILQTDRPRVGGSDSVVGMLERNAKGVLTHGDTVRSVGGVRGGWWSWVNGIAEAPDALKPPRVHQGDRVWWDAHGGAARRVPAVVGQFPEPFVHGVDGRRLPTRVECVRQSEPACDAVASRLVDLGLPAAKGGLARSLVKETLRVVVGPWKALREDPTVTRLETGPAVSGVFARPAPDGRSIALLDARGRTTRRLGPGTGLIAATAADDVAPVWIVTGTDERGIQAAAAALDEGALAGRLAVAVVGGRPVGLPDRG